MAKKIIKSSKKTTKKLRKFEDGGMAGKGPLKPESKKVLTSEEAAKEAMSRLTNPFGLSKTEMPSIEGKSPLQSVVKTETPKAAVVAPKAKPLPGGFKDQAQKDAYIKSTKNLLKTKSVADLVKMKHGTAAGLAALGFKDEVKKAAPVAKAPVAKAPIKKNNKPVSKPLNLGQKQAKTYRNQVVDTKSVYGVTRGGKDISTTVATKRSGDKLVKVTSINKGSATGEGRKTAYKVIPNRTQVSEKGNLLHINKKGTVLTKKDKKTGDITVRKGKNIEFIPGKELQIQYDTNSLSDKMVKKSPAAKTKNKPATKANKKSTPTKKQAERTTKFLATGTYPMFKKGGKITTKKK